MGNLKNSENAHNLDLGEHGLKGPDISVWLKLSFIITVVGSLPRLDQTDDEQRFREKERTWMFCSEGIPDTLASKMCCSFILR